jgi:alpha-tubulin suppressor-like RCC1 family protein
MPRTFIVASLLASFTVGGECGPGAPLVADAPGSMVAMGTDHGCVLRAGTLACFGGNSQGQLGLGQASEAELTPVAVPLPEPIAQVVAGLAVSCARSTSGRVWCWGDDSLGRLARVPVGSQLSPLEIRLPVPISQLALNSDFVLALGSDGRLFGWGDDSEGTLGRGGEAQDVLFADGVVRAAQGRWFDAISAGQGSACGREADQSLWCWGRNESSELALPNPPIQYRLPTKVLDGVSAFSAGNYQTCAVQQGQLTCSEAPSDLADGGLAYAPAMTPVGFAATARVPALRFLHQCVLDSNQGLWCWGRNAEGQLGLGDVEPRSAPTHVLDGVTSVGVGDFATCALTTTLEVRCMGANELGQLGLGDTSRRDVPTAQ